VFLDGFQNAVNLPGCTPKSDRKSDRKREERVDEISLALNVLGTVP
jgi:hypothetical protein